MTFMQIMNLRTEFEEIIKDFNMGCQVMQGHSKSDINTIEWFVEHGFRSNRLRNDYDRAIEIANIIKEYADGCAEEVRAGECI